MALAELRQTMLLAPSKSCEKAPNAHYGFFVLASSSRLRSPNSLAPSAHLGYHLDAMLLAFSIVERAATNFFNR